MRCLLSLCTREEGFTNCESFGVDLRGSARHETTTVSSEIRKGIGDNGSLVTDSRQHEKRLVSTMVSDGVSLSVITIEPSSRWKN